MTMISRINHQVMTSSRILTDRKVTGQVSEEMTMEVVLSDHAMIVRVMAEVMIDLVLIVPHQVTVLSILCHSNCEEKMKKKPAAPVNSAPRRDSADKST